MDQCGKKSVPSFMKTVTGVRAISRFCLNTLRDCNTVINDERDLRITPCRWSHMSRYTYQVS
jgi:hypothetical protein